MPKVLSLAWEIILEIKHALEDKHLYINTLSWDRPTICYNDDDDEDCTIAITPILSTEEPDNSLSMGDEHLDTISETESDEVIKFTVENLVPIPSESKGIPENICDVPFHDNSSPLDISKDQFEDFYNSNDDSTLIDDDSFSIDDIEYVEPSPPDSEPVSLDVMDIVIQEVGGIDADILLTIKDDILHEKMLNINLLIANIEALKDNPTSSFDFMTKSSSTSLNFLLEETNTFDNSLPEFETFCFDSEEISSGSTTTRADISLQNYEAFYDDHIARAYIAGLQREQMGHDDEIVLARVKISTLEMIIEDIQCDDSYFYSGLLWFSYHLAFLKPSMAPKRTSTYAIPAMTQAAIRKLVADSAATALEAQAANMENANNTNRNTKPREAPVARK
uniref:Uncharacterized protein n=1 Tax=Tanacetum cinerariifolium TaxID=118510 RepID=A0A699JXY9_TANCI|nr:hypothetical protein [Tanacetum cinerariifolium]